ncbi:MAG: DNA/RNA non-specific endonuclease [Bacteroidota bacterium]
MILKVTITLFSILLWVHAYGQKTFSSLNATEKKLYKEHLVEGQPDGAAPVYVRQGFVLNYNDQYRIPNWVAYHIKPDYLKTPKRERKYKTFRTDPDTPNAVRNEDYTGTGYARGHMAPYFAMGGDRDKNGVYSNAEDDNEDPHDDKTVFQANYMSNMTPQDQDALNGSGGPWYNLETFIRDKLVRKHKMELNIFTGSIVSDPQEYEVLENNEGVTDIAVPDQFYQIIIWYNKTSKEYITAAFLFPHVTEKEDLPYTELLDYIVTVDEVEKITGLNFLNQLSEAAQKKVESKTNLEFWETKTGR